MDIEKCLDAAVDAYRNVEQRQLALDKAEAMHTLALAELGKVDVTNETRAEYVRRTDAVSEEFTRKRVKAGLT